MSYRHRLGRVALSVGIAAAMTVNPRKATAEHWAAEKARKNAVLDAQAEAIAKDLSPRQRKIRKRNANKVRILQALSECPGLFEVPGTVVSLSQFDRGTVLGVSYTHGELGIRQGFRVSAVLLSKDVTYIELARRVREVAEKFFRSCGQVAILASQLQAGVTANEDVAPEHPTGESDE